MSPQINDPSAPLVVGASLGGVTKKKRNPDEIASPTDNIGTIETAAHKTLPTSFTWALANQKMQQKELEKAARLIAHSLEVPRSYIWGNTDWTTVQDPVTGGPLSFKTMMRLTDGMAPEVVKSLLQQYLAPDGGTVQIRSGKTPGTMVPVDPRRISRFAKALGEGLSSYPIDLATGLAMATALARGNLNPKKFSANLHAIQEWVTSTGQSLPVGVGQMVAMAQTATANGRTLANNTDVAAFLFPTLAKQAGIEATTSFTGGVVPPALLKKLSGQPQPQTQLLHGETSLTAQGQLTGLSGGQLTPEAQKLFDAQSQDYFSLAQDLQTQIVLDQTAFQRSLLGKAVNVGLKVVNQGWVALEHVVGDAGFVPFLALNELGAALPGGPSFQDAYRNAIDTRQFYIQRINSGDTMGHQFAEAAGLPRWTGTAFDFVVGWELDPFRLGGDVLTAFRTLKVAPGLLEAGAAGERFGGTAYEQAANFENSTLKWAASKDSRAVFEAAYKSPEDMLRQIDRLATNYEARSALDLAYMSRLRDELLTRFPAASDAAWQEWKQGIWAHFGIQVPDGSVGAIAYAGRNAEADYAASVLSQKEIIGGKTYGSTESGLLVPDATASELAAATIAKNATDLGIPLRMEVPHDLNPLPGFGIKKLAGLKFGESWLGGTELGIRTREVLGINPGNVFKIEEDPLRYIGLAGVRARLPESVIRSYQTEALDIINSGVQRETRLVDLVTRMHTQAIDDIFATHNIPGDIQKALLSDAQGAVDAMNRPVFGALKSGGLGKVETVGQPLLESQLVNEVQFLDPVAVRKLANRYVGTIRRMRDSLLSVVGADLPEITSQVWTTKLLAPLIDAEQSIARGVQRTWKFLVVPRAGYLGRVVLGDENARFLATTNSLFERVTAQELNIGVGRFKADIGGFLDRRGYLDQTIQVGDTPVTVARAGAYNYEPLANQASRNEQLMNDLLQRSTLNGKALHATGDYGVITQGMPQYEVAWSHALNDQLANSVPGQVALRSVAAGESVTDTTNALLRWARKDNYAILSSRLGISPADSQEWADSLAKMTHAYTLSDPELAGAAMARSIEPDMLKNVADHPPVHGPLMDSLTNGNALKRATDKWYDMWVRQPESVLNRQPYYKVWKRRAEVSYYRWLEAKLGTGPVSETLTNESVIPYVFGRGKVNPFASEQTLREQGALESDYLFHATQPETVPIIAADGLHPLVGTWEDGTTGARLYLSKGGPFALDAPDAERNALLRIKAEAAPALTEDPAMAHSGYTTTGDIHPQEIEFFAKDGTWHPIADAAPSGTRLVPPRGVTPELAAKIDQASRQFALAQTKKIMFDFTENTRLGELVSGVIPFSQPFAEAFHVWGDILLHRNPALIGYVNTLARTGLESGFIRHDENGQLVVPMTAFTAIMPLFGLAPKGFSMSAPLSSFNLFLASTFRLPTTGVIGALAGGTPMMVPGLAPWAALPLKYLFKDTRSLSVASWLFQYGPGTSLVPPWLERVARGTFPQAFNDDRNTASAMDFLRLYQYLGTDKGPDGLPLPHSVLEARALADAKKMNAFRAAVSFTSPASPQVNFPTSAMEQEYRNLIDTYSADRKPDPWGRARDAFLKKYPGQTLVTVGKTFWGRQLEDATAPRVPSSQYAQQVLRTPGFSDFAQKYPAWAAALILSGDQSNKFDFGVFAQQIADGDIHYKGLDRFLTEGESSGFWQAVDATYHLYDARLEALNQAGLADDNRQVIDLKHELTQQLYQISQHFPGPAKQYFIVSNTDATANWSDPGNAGAPKEIVLMQARSIMQLKGFQDFPAIQGLNQYMTGRDAIYAEMARKGVTDITSASAIDTGLAAAYDKLVTQTKAQFPEFTPFLSSFFARDLRSVPNAAQTRLLSMQTNNPERYAKYTAFDTQLNTLQAATSQQQTTPDRFAAYQAVRDYIDGIQQTSDWQLKLWWKSKSYSTQQQYIDSLQVRPPEFMSGFDLHLMGIDITPTAASLLHAIGEAKVKIGQAKAASLLRGDEKAYDTGAAYDAIDAFVNKHIKDDPSFAAAVAATNTWAWGIRSFADQKGSAGAAWTHIFEGLDGLQKAVDNYQTSLTSKGLHGINYGSQAQKSIYAQARDQLLKYVQSWRDYSGAFDAQWKQLQQTLQGDPPITYLMPDDWFRLGG